MADDRSATARGSRMKAVTIRGEPGLFAGLLDIAGLDIDHAQSADVAGQHILLAYASDEAIEAMRDLGLTVEVTATEADEQAELAQLFDVGGPDVTDIDIG